MRTALAHAPAKRRTAVAAMLETIFAQDSTTGADARWDTVAVPELTPPHRGHGPSPPSGAIMVETNDERTVAHRYMSAENPRARTTIPTSGCPPGRPDRTRAFPKVGALSPCRGTLSFMDHDRVAPFELTLQDGEIKVADERHSRLVPAGALNRKAGRDDRCKADLRHSVSK